MWCSMLLLAAIVACASAHGRVLRPPSRSSAWRFQFPTPADYDDDGANCGGYSTQHNGNGGKCGICGDAYNIPPPRPHEIGGYYGVGLIVANYAPESTISTTVELTTSHRGFWEFKLCPDPQSIDQACFDKYVLELEDGTTKYFPSEGSTKYEVIYKLPKGLTCEHCVLQWRYTAGNNWGICGNGTQGLGCGPQEQFGACSDISIGAGKQNDVPSEAKYPLMYYLRNGFANQQELINLLRGYVRAPAIQSNAHTAPRSPQTNQRLTQSTQPVQIQQQNQPVYNRAQENQITPLKNQVSPPPNQQVPIQQTPRPNPNHHRQKQPLGQNEQRQILEHITSQINKAIQLQNQVTNQNAQNVRQNQQNSRPNKNQNPKQTTQYPNQIHTNEALQRQQQISFLNHNTRNPNHSAPHSPSTARPYSTYSPKGRRNQGKKPLKSARYKKAGKKRKGKPRKRKKKTSPYSTIEYNRVIRVGSW